MSTATTAFAELTDLSIPKRFSIVEGAEYIYCAPSPPRCRGHRYKVLRFVVNVPSYQQLVLVEALTGPDRGLWFCCTPSNFSSRYVAADTEGNDGSAA